MAHTKIVSYSYRRLSCGRGGELDNNFVPVGYRNVDDPSPKGYLGASQITFPDETDTVSGAEASQCGWIPIAGPRTGHG